MSELALRVGLHSILRNKESMNEFVTQKVGFYLTHMIGLSVWVWEYHFFYFTLGITLRLPDRVLFYHGAGRGSIAPTEPPSPLATGLYCIGLFPEGIAPCRPLLNSTRNLQCTETMLCIESNYTAHFACFFIEKAMGKPSIPSA